MRVTQGMYYKNLYGNNNSQLQSKLFDVNKQIASGLNIQYAHDDVRTFSDTMRLDNEITTLGQILTSTESGYKVSNQTDSVLNDFTESLTRTKTLLVQAANDTQNATSRNAIAVELRGLEDHFKNLANTSINGQYLFSGSAVDIKPISDDGTYMGNGQSMNAFLGSGVEQDYNLSGANLFLGEEARVNRSITTNVPQYNLSTQYPDFSDPNSDTNGIESVIKAEDTIRDLMGSTSDVENSASHFYIRGTKSSGEAFTEHISMNDNETVGELLTQIGNAFGNTSDLNLVNVSLDPQGLIIIQDKLKGSSKLDFHMVGALDHDQTDLSNAADVSDQSYGVNIGDINNLAVGETDFNKIIKGTSTATNTNLYVKTFVQSSFEAAPGTQDLVTSLHYDRTLFSKDGSTLNSTTPQVLKTNNTFATDSTKISEVADISKGTLSTADDTLAGSRFILEGSDTSGTSYKAAINFRSTANGGSDFQVDTTGNGLADTTYKIYDTSIPRKAVNADDMTYRQLMDVVNMLTTGDLPGAIATVRGDLVAGAGLNITIDDMDSSTPPIPPILSPAVASVDPDFNGANYEAQINADLVAAGVTDLKVSYDTATNQLTFTNSGTSSYNMTVNAADDGTSGLAGRTIRPITEEYDYAIESSELLGKTFLSYDGKVTFTDQQNNDTKAGISLYDDNAGDFNPTHVESSALTFNANNALTISDPKTDFFKRLDEIISAVEENKIHPDGRSGSTRNVGISNSLTMLDNLAEHVARSQSQVGSNSNALSASIERTTLLEVSTKILRSSVVEVDLAEASLKLTQLSLNYQAMLSTVGKISQLSLVNYL